MRREHPRKVPVAEAPLSRAQRPPRRRPLPRDALVRRQVPQARQRDDAPAQEPAARHIVIGHLRERMVQHLLCRHHHRRPPRAPVRDISRGLRPGGRGTSEGGEVRVRARARERRRERRERPHRDVEQAVHVPARRAVPVHERLPTVWQALPAARRCRHRQLR